MSRWTVLFFSVIPASGTRQIDKTFIKGLVTIQDQELCKSHNKRKLRQQYRKSRFSGDKTAPLEKYLQLKHTVIQSIKKKIRFA